MCVRRRSVGGSSISIALRVPHIESRRGHMQHVEDIIYAKQDGVATVSINRPWVLNAFRPRTIDEMMEAFDDAWYDDRIGVVVLTGEQDNFCTGGDQKIRSQGGCQEADRTPCLHGRTFARSVR